MIDYLEQLFLVEAENMQGGEEIPALPRMKVEQELVDFRAPVIPEGEVVEEVSTKAGGDVEIFLPRSSRVLSEPLQEAERTSAVPVFRRREEAAGVQELEHRLRRDSRRYDSGFYRY